MDDVEARVLRLIEHHFERIPSERLLDAHFVHDLGGDSISTVEFILICENEFGITIPNDSAAEILTPRMAVEYIKRHL